MLLVIAAAVIALFALIPLFFVAGYAVGIGPGVAAAMVFRPRVGELLWNTATLTAGCMAASVVIGTGAAYLVERTNLPGRRAFNILLVAPLAIPAFVNAYGWVSVLPGATGYGGALLIVTLSYYPLVYLPAVAALRGLDPALEEASYSLGLGRAKTFLRVIAPQLKPAVLGGGLLVGLHLLAEFGALQMLQFPTFTTAIYDLYQSSFNGPAANMLAGVLVLACLLLLVTEMRLRGNARYARLGSGSARPAPRIRLGALHPLALAAMAALVVLAVGVPIGSLVFWLVTGSSTTFDASSLLATGLTSLGLGIAAAVITTAVALPAAWLYVRRPGRLSTVLERSTYLASALPGIVVALALVTVTIKTLPAVYQTTVTLMAAYVIMFLPLAMVSVRSALAQAPPILDDVAHALGSGRIATLRRVVLPLIAPGLGAGAVLVFLSTVTELTATLLLAPIGTETLATQFWAASSAIAYGKAAPYAAAMIVISAPATYLLTRSAGSVRGGRAERRAAKARRARHPAVSEALNNPTRQP